MEGEARWVEVPEGGAQTITAGVLAVLGYADDPDDTLNLALTQSESVLVLHGLYLATRLTPELNPHIRGLVNRLDELAEAQGFQYHRWSDDNA